MSTCSVPLYTVYSVSAAHVASLFKKKKKKRIKDRQKKRKRKSGWRTWQGPASPTSLWLTEKKRSMVPNMAQAATKWPKRPTWLEMKYLQTNVGNYTCNPLWRSEIMTKTFFAATDKSSEVGRQLPEWWGLLHVSVQWNPWWETNGEGCYMCLYSGTPGERPMERAATCVCTVEPLVRDHPFLRPLVWNLSLQVHNSMSMNQSLRTTLYEERLCWVSSADLKAAFLNLGRLLIWMSQSWCSVRPTWKTTQSNTLLDPNGRQLIWKRVMRCMGPKWLTT